jgi:cell division topological specificity factor
MNVFKFFRRGGSAPVARERLQILLAHERKASSQPDLLNVLREEILAVVAKHIALDPDRVRISMDRGDPISVLEVDIEIPNKPAHLPPGSLCTLRERRLAGELGFEPRLAESESAVLPLDDSPSASSGLVRRFIALARARVNALQIHCHMRHKPLLLLGFPFASRRHRGHRPGRGARLERMMR